MTFLKSEQVGNVLTLTLNQPATRNALTGNTAIAELLEAIARAATDPKIRVLILTGADPVFCSGGNVKDMQRFHDPSMDPAAIREDYRHGIQRLTRALYQLDVPTIALVNGPAMGAGLDLACMCDIRIGSERAKFAESFVRVGIVPGDGGAWLLPRVIGRSRASEMAFTGDAIDAAQALEWGLVSKIVPHDSLLDEGRALAGRIAINPGNVLRMTKRLIREADDSSLEQLLELSAAYQAIAHKSVEHREAVMAFVEKRQPRFD